MSEAKFKKKKVGSCVPLNQEPGVTLHEQHEQLPGYLESQIHGLARRDTAEECPFDALILSW